MSYTVKFEIYNTDIKVVKTIDEFKTALAIQDVLSSIAELNNWTRHSSCTSIVRHADIVFDLYNEGAIMVEPVKS